MIAGRPTNLWLGFTTSLVGLAAILALAAGVDPELVAQLGAGVTAVLGAAIALVAYQPPTLNAGDPINVLPKNGGPPMTVATPTPRDGDTERRAP